MEEREGMKTVITNTKERLDALEYFYILGLDVTLELKPELKELDLVNEGLPEPFRTHFYAMIDVMSEYRMKHEEEKGKG